VESHEARVVRLITIIASQFSDLVCYQDDMVEAFQFNIQNQQDVRAEADTQDFAERGEKSLPSLLCFASPSTFTKTTLYG